MNTIAIAAYARTENCLWKIVADIQPKLTPDFLADIVSYAIAYITLFKKIADYFDSFTLKWWFILSKNNANCGLAIKLIAVWLFVGCHFDQSRKNMGHANLCSYYFFAVYTIHQTHNNRVLASCLFDCI